MKRSMYVGCQELVRTEALLSIDKEYPWMVAEDDEKRYLVQRCCKDTNADEIGKAPVNHG